MAEQAKKQERNVGRSPQYRLFPADIFSLRVNDNNLQITFGLETNMPDETNSVVQEATVFLTPRAAKVLQLLLSGTLEGLEAAFGRIPLPPGKEEELMKITSRIKGSVVQKPQ